MTDVAPIHDAAELTRYIEKRYHARHREELPALADLAAKVESVHASHERVPSGLTDLLRRMSGEMEVHMKKEELILFPAIRNGGASGTENPIAVMRADHDDHMIDLAEIRRLTGDLSLPHDACGTWVALYDGLAVFTTDLEEHIRLENDVLFPQFEPKGRAHG